MGINIADTLNKLIPRQYKHKQLIVKHLRINFVIGIKE